MNRPFALWLLCSLSGLSAFPQSVLQFTAPEFTVVEGVTNAPVQVERSGDVNIEITVDYMTLNGSAASGGDYITTNGTITFAYGQTKQTIVVPVLDDGAVEGVESILLILGNAGAGATLGPRSNAVLTIHDNEFPSMLDGSFDSGGGADNDVFAVALQPDGNILFAGQFVSVSGVRRTRIARLTADGLLDTSFTPPEINGDVYAMALQPDGRIVVGGAFTQIGGSPVQYVARLNSDGARDLSFQQGANNELRAVAIQPDGRIVIAGRFTSVGGQARGRVARLLYSGALDTAFDPGTGADNNVRAMALQADGKIVIGGQFTAVNGVSRIRIARLNANGSLDLDFNPGTGANGTVRAIAPLADGTIYIGGEFYYYNGTPRNYVARLLASGGLDTNFQPAPIEGFLRALAVQPDGKVWMGGGFEEVDQLSREAFARLNPDGSLDRTYDTRAGANNEVFAMVLQTNGAVIIAGQFTTVDGMARGHVARLHPSNDVPVVEFASTTFGAAEAHGEARISVTRRGQTEGAAQVQYVAAEQTATQGQDFVGQSGTLAFAPREITRTFNVPLLEDIELEPTETVLLLLSSPIGATLGSKRALLNIVNGGGSSEFSAGPAFSISETTPATGIIVYQGGDTNLEVTVNYRTHDGTASAGLDYVEQSGTLTFPPGIRTVPLPLPLLNDSIKEADETFRLALYDPTTAALRGSVTITIVDNEVGLGFGAPAFEINEYDSALVIHVFKEWDTTNDVTVPYTTVAGTAETGVDYRAVTGVVTFRPNEGAATISIPIYNDGFVEGAEWFSVSLGTPSGGVALLPISAALVAVNDNDRGIEFVSDEHVVGETEGATTLIVRRGDDGTNDLAVSYSMTDGTAGGGEDYARQSGTIVLAPGQTAGIPVTVADDTLVEVDETFEVTLHGSGNSVLGRTNRTLVRIADNERPGSVDMSFNSGIRSAIGQIVRQPDGKLVLRGAFWTWLRYMEEYHDPVIRLLPDGLRDTSFTAQTGPHNGIWSMAVQPDGKVLYGSISYMPDGAPAKPLRRLNADGSCDTNFAESCLSLGWQSVLDGSARDIGLQSDGKILLVGAVRTNYSAATFNIVRLLTNGIPDTNFNVVTTAVNVIEVQGDDSIMAGGQGAVLRFDSNGQPLPFGPPLLIDGGVSVLRTDSNGRILIGGSFESVNGVERTNLARLNSDGSLDPTLGAVGIYGVRAIALQADGRILVGGEFGTVNGLEHRGLVRLNDDGTIDRSFDVGSGPDGPVNSIIVLPDDNILIGGEFNNINGVPRPGIARLGGASGNWSSLQVAARPSVSESHGDLVIEVQRGGLTNLTTNVDYFTADGTAHSTTDYLGTSGTLIFAPGETVKTIRISIREEAVPEADEIFRLELRHSAGGVALPARDSVAFTIVDNDRSASLDASLRTTVDNGDVGKIVVQPDGKLIIAGTFYYVNGVARPLLARLHVDGSLDGTFQPPQIGTGTFQVYTIALQDDGRILIGGDFRSIGIVPRSGLARLNADGSLDDSFQADAQPNFAGPMVTAITVQSDGKILVGGSYTHINGVARNGIARLHPNGAIDAGFDPGAGASAAQGGVMDIAVQADGKILAGGGFLSFNSQPRAFLVRLNSDGTIDDSFNDQDTGGWVYAIRILDGGKILIAGGFSNVEGVSRNRIARLNPDGSLDRTTAVGLGANGAVRSLAIQADRKVLIAGFFDAVNGTPMRNLARLNPDLSLDREFKVDPFLPGYLQTVALEADGQILAGGYFPSISGLGIGGIVRLNGGYPFEFAPIVTISGGQAHFRIFTQPAKAYVLQGSSNLTDWTSIQTNAALSNRIDWFDSRALEHRFYRALRQP